MNTKEIVDHIQNGKLDQMREVASNLLTAKAIDRLEERKIEIAKSYFGQVQEDVEELEEGQPKPAWNKKSRHPSMREPAKSTGSWGSKKPKNPYKEYVRGKGHKLYSNPTAKE